ncbi:hypothetical protein A6A26_03425 [Pantoea sp. OXWO6B1]|nr:hypothetical protein A6A26_03425 [Pantoea sp. OXWO6B1]
MLIEGIFLFCWLITLLTTPARIGFSVLTRAILTCALARLLFLFSQLVTPAADIKAIIFVSQETAARLDATIRPDRLIIAAQILSFCVKCIFSLTDCA